MKNVVVSMQNTLLAEAVAGAFQKTGDFRVEQVLPGRPGDAPSLCASAKADVLLMEVSRLGGYTLESRMHVINTVRRAAPGCKFALLCDENSDPELAQRVMRTRQDRLIDAFFYASVTSQYLTAAVDAL